MDSEVSTAKEYSAEFVADTRPPRRVRLQLGGHIVVNYEGSVFQLTKLDWELIGKINAVLNQYLEDRDEQ